MGTTREVNMHDVVYRCIALFVVVVFFFTVFHGECIHTHMRNNTLVHVIFYSLLKSCCLVAVFFSHLSFQVYALLFCSIPVCVLFDVSFGFFLYFNSLSPSLFDDRQ